MTLVLLILLMAGILIGLALWVLIHRNRLDDLNRKLPFSRTQRQARLDPLFETRGEAAWFAVWMLLVGSLLLGALILRIFV